MRVCMYEAIKSACTQKPGGGHIPPYFHKLLCSVLSCRLEDQPFIVCESRGGSREKSDQGSTKKLIGVAIWVWKISQNYEQKGPVGPTFIIDLKFDILDFSKGAIKHVVHFVLFC